MDVERMGGMAPARVDIFRKLGFVGLKNAVKRIRKCIQVGNTGYFIMGIACTKNIKVRSDLLVQSNQVYFYLTEAMSHELQFQAEVT